MTKQDLVHTIIDGIQDSKGLNIVVADLSKLENTICNYMIICEGNSNTHVNALATNLREYVREHHGEKPMAMEGFENCEWIVLDYTDVMVHVMQRAPRAFYDLEHLWEDADLTHIEDLL